MSRGKVFEKHIKHLEHHSIVEFLVYKDLYGNLLAGFYKYANGDIKYVEPTPQLSFGRTEEESTNDKITKCLKKQTEALSTSPAYYYCLVFGLVGSVCSIGAGMYCLIPFHW